MKEVSSDDKILIDRNLMKSIAATPDFWYAENEEAIVKRFDLKSPSERTSAMLLIFFIEKEILGIIK